MTKTDFDVTVIGAGVVGLAVAYKLAQMGMNVLIVEKHSSFGKETSSRNSEVIHSGIYYPKNSLKAKLCIEGNKKTYEWCSKYNIPHKKIGKFIVATRVEEYFILDKIYKQGLENGVENLKKFDDISLSRIEPNINAIGSIFVPSTGILSSHLFMESIFENSKPYNYSYAFMHLVKSIEYQSSVYKIVVRDPNMNDFSFTTTRVVNSAGLEADNIAKMVGIDIEKNGYELQYCKGSYFRIYSRKKDIVKHLIYPLPDSEEGGLGIHLTKDLENDIRVGPDTEWLTNRTINYSVDPELATKFFEAISKYLKNITLEDLYPDTSGIRPKLKSASKSFQDFIIKEESENGFPNFVNLIGIESPGLTASLAIADYVAQYWE